MRFAIRLSLPDRRGALSAVSSAIGKAGGNILSLDVVGVVDGMAVDDITVEAEVEPDLLRRAIEDVPSVVVETIVHSDTFRDLTAPLRLATRLVDGGVGAVRLLVDGLPEALWATWAIVVAGTHTGPEILHRSGNVPSVEGLEAPWMPLDDGRRLQRAPWMPEAWQDLTQLQVAAAPLVERNTAVLMGRNEGPRFLPAEVDQLGRLAHIAVRAEVLGAGASRLQA
ncbi:ACT domain-containing protein [Euzebya tangerina]|uniref:ACT domain-containing protein n=1 Tax=Euzebya tangerina TaxID=591198 RepID=UPI0013C2BF7F|nr:ACT domain-containing protein [Euzebya tangerina]